METVCKWLQHNMGVILPGNILPLLILLRIFMVEKKVLVYTVKSAYYRPITHAAPQLLGSLQVYDIKIQNSGSACCHYDNRCRFFTIGYFFLFAMSRKLCHCDKTFDMFSSHYPSLGMQVTKVISIRAWSPYQALLEFNDYAYKY